MLCWVLRWNGTHPGYGSCPHQYGSLLGKADEQEKKHSVFLHLQFILATKHFIGFLSWEIFSWDRTKTSSNYKGWRYVHVSLVAESCPTLCDPMDCSLPGFSVHRISQTRILEWVAMPLPPGDLPKPETEPWPPASPALQVDSLPLSHLGAVGPFP